MVFTEPVKEYSECFIYRGISSDHKGVDVTPKDGKTKTLVAIDNATVYYEGYGKNFYGAWIDKQVEDYKNTGGKSGFSELMAQKYRNEIIIWLKLDNGWIAKYGHCLETWVNAGTRVEKGQEIGLMGSTGNSTGIHLHLELEDRSVSPYKYYDFRDNLGGAQGSIGIPQNTALPVDFNEEAYLFLNPDVKQAVMAGKFLTGANHYARFGVSEGRLFKQSDMDKVLELQAQLAEKDRAILNKDTELQNIRNQFRSEFELYKQQQQQLQDQKLEEKQREVENLILEKEAIGTDLENLKDTISDENMTDSEREKVLEEQRDERLEYETKLKAKDTLISERDKKIQELAEQVKLDGTIGNLSHEVQAFLKSNLKLKDKITNAPHSINAKDFPAPIWYLVDRFRRQSWVHSIVYKGIVVILGIPAALALQPHIAPLVGANNIIDFLTALGTTSTLLFAWLETRYAKNAIAITIVQALLAEGLNLWRLHLESKKKGEDVKPSMLESIHSDRASIQPL